MKSRRSRSTDKILANKKTHKSSSKHRSSFSTNAVNTRRSSTVSILSLDSSASMTPYVFKWQLSGCQLDAFKRSKHEEGFQSQDFKINNSSHKIIGNIIWKLECFPNGYFGDDLNKIKLYLTSVRLPPNISKILACFSVVVLETGIRYVGTDEFTYNQCQCQWDDDMMSFDRIQSLTTLTFECFIDILQIHYEKDERTGGKAKESKVKLYSDLSFQWNVNESLLNEFKQSNIGQLFCSSYCRYFWFQLIPNGYTADNKGKMKLYLESVGAGLLPSGIRTIKLKYKIKCKQLKFEKEDIVKIKKKAGYSAIGNFNFGKLREIKKLKTLTLKCHLRILSIYDAKKREIDQKYWSKYGIIPDEICTNHTIDTNEDQEELEGQIVQYDHERIQSESISNETQNSDHTVIIHEEELISNTKRSQPQSMESTVSHCIDDRNHTYDCTEYIETDTNLDKTRNSNDFDINPLHKCTEEKESEREEKENDENEFTGMSVMTFDEMVSNLTNIGDDGVDNIEDDTIASNNIEDESGQRANHSDRQSCGRFTIEPSKSASANSVLELQSPSFTSSTTPKMISTPKVAHIQMDQVINSKSNSKTPTDATSIGRFLVSNKLNKETKSYDVEFKEEFENIWKEIKGLKHDMNDIKEMKENINQLSESLERIKMNQYNILSKLEFDPKVCLPQHNALKMWLCDGLHLELYLDAFIREGFEDISLLCYLNENDLIALGVQKMAHRKKIINAIKSLKKAFATKEECFILNSTSVNDLNMDDEHILNDDNNQNCST